MTDRYRDRVVTLVILVVAAVSLYAATLVRFAFMG